MLSEKKTNSHAKCFKKFSPSVPDSIVESNQFDLRSTPQAKQASPDLPLSTGKENLSVNKPPKPRRLAESKSALVL